MSVALNIYQRLPPFSKSVAASLRGYYLNWWRYDDQTDRLVEEVLERDYWSEKQWIDWRSDRLSFALERAAEQVPYYRKVWTERRKKGDRASWSYLENWDVLDKESVRAASIEFVSDDCQSSKMFHDHTSGTTGTSLDLWLTKATVKAWYALFEARARRWYGLTRNDRWAILGGQLVSPVNRQRPPFWVWNAGLNQLYLSSYHLSPDLIPSYLKALCRYQIKYILGYPSAIFALAQEVLKQGRTDLAMGVVITNAEPLYDHQRDVITQAFGCPVRETYGMAEIVAAASECEKGSMHQWPEAGIIEAEDRKDGRSAELICTGLMNVDMPLIRYRVGDTGKLSNKICECGRTLPIIEKIEGRTDDALYTIDGRRVGRLDPVFKGRLPLREAQIIQESLAKVKVRYVPAHDFEDHALGIVAERLRERMGDVEIEFDRVTAIPRSSRGKFRAVICNLPAAEISDLSDSFVDREVVDK